MPAELKNCPFCGNHANFLQDSSDEGAWYVECNFCQASTMSHYEKWRVLCLWNHRDGQEEFEQYDENCNLIEENKS